MTEKQTISAPYGASSTARLRFALLVRPNSGLDRLTPLYAEPSSIVERAHEQHAILIRTLNDMGVRTQVLEAADSSGFATFVADCALLVDRGAILLRPSRIERRKEVAAVEAALGDMGIPIVGRIDAPGLLDGNDIAIAGDVAYIGVPVAPGPPRSNTLGRRQLESILSASGIRTVELPLAADISRLGFVFTPVADDLVVAAPDYVELSALGNSIQIVEISRGDQLGAGLLTLAPRRAIANLRFRTALPVLRKAKIDVEAIDLWEFGKVGAGPSSLVLTLKRG